MKHLPIDSKSDYEAGLSQTVLSFCIHKMDRRIEKFIGTTTATGESSSSF